MSWVDRLRPASFRGVPFRVEGLDADLGRRVTIHRFPARSDIEDDDQGLDARTYSISAYVIGDDYDSDLARLEAALLTGGVGRLVHPTRGEKSVVVHERIKVHEAPAKEGGFASVTFTVTEKEPSRSSFSTTAPASVLRSRVDLTIASIASGFEDDFSTATLPSSGVTSQVAKTRSIGATFASVGSRLGGVVSDLTALTNAAVTLERNAVQLVAAPATLAATVQVALTATFAAAANVLDASEDLAAELIAQQRAIVSAVLGALDILIGSSTPVELDDSTPNRLIETTNLRLLDGLVRGASIAAAAGSLVDLPWTSYQEAIGARDRVSAIVDEVAEHLSDASYRALLDLRVAVRAYLESVASTLPELRKYEVQFETCAILLAHELLGDSRREGELLARNQIENPALIPPGTILEVPSA